MNKYVFQKRWKKILALIFDTVGSASAFLFLKKKISPSPEKIKNILVIRLDHMGDVVLTIPALKELRTLFPQAKITALVSPVGEEILSLENLVEETIVLEDHWFSRSQKTKTKKNIETVRLLWKTAKALQRQHFDLGIDFRGDLRHILMMRLARIPYLIGFGKTGGGFLLDLEVPSQPLVPAWQENLRCLAPLLKQDTFTQPLIQLKNLSPPLFAQMLPHDFATIHIGAGTEAKAWSPGAWQNLLANLSPLPLVLVGDSAAREKAQAILEESHLHTLDLTGKTNVTDLAWLLKQSRFLITADSGPAHLGAALGTPTVVLFSGTNEVSLWAPPHPHVRILYHSTHCAPCYRTFCPLARHWCMEAISPVQVVAALKQLQVFEPGPRKYAL